MGLGFPDMSMVVTIIFFILIALILIIAAGLIMERSQPEFVISSVFFLSPLGLRRSKKGVAGLIVFGILLLAVVFALLIAFQSDFLMSMFNGVISLFSNLVPGL